MWQLPWETAASVSRLTMFVCSCQVTSVNILFFCVVVQTWLPLKLWDPDSHIGNNPHCFLSSSQAWHLLEASVLVVCVLDFEELQVSQRSPVAYFLVKIALFKQFNLAGCREIQPSKLWLCLRTSQPGKLVKPNYRNNRKLVQTRRFFSISSTCSVSQIFSLAVWIPCSWCFAFFSSSIVSSFFFFFPHSTVPAWITCLLPLTADKWLSLFGRRFYFILFFCV